MISQWKSLLQERLSDWDLPPEGDWSFLVFNNYHPQCTNIDLFWFHAGGAFPRVVTKLCSQETVARREYQSLVRVHPYAPMAIPKPLNFEPLDGFWALWMEGVRGAAPRSEDYDASRLRLLVDLIAGIHSAVRTAEDGAPERYRRMVLEPIEVVSDFGQDTSVQEGLAKVRSQVSLDWISSLPVVPQHGDLFSGNLLLDGNQWRVIDWESFGLIDLPCYDLLTLLISLFTQNGGDPDGWDPGLKELAPTLLGAYSQTLGLGPANISLLLPLTLANWFHLQWSDGRQPFAGHMYEIIQAYFKHSEKWHKVLTPRNLA